MKNFSKTTKAVLAILVVAIATTTGITPAFADFEDYSWSRSSGDGHLGLLNCGTGSNSDNCDIKIKTTSGVQGYSQTTLNNEVNDVETHFDTDVNKKMSIDRVSTADSIIHQTNRPNGENGYTDYERHCTAYHWLWWWHCVTWDDHYVKMDVQLNDNSSEVKFKLAENSGANPQEFDLRKTLGHELWHAMGVDHDNTDTDNISYYVYVFGSTSGYEATAGEEDHLEDLYP